MTTEGDHMRTIAPDELTKILADHKLWRESGGRSGARANLARANLARANLARANLARAYLADAYLADADLADANLAGAYLADAYLAGANLARANLADANLAGAYLADAYLADADLADANLAGAYLADAYLAGANLARANLADANLAGAYLADANLAGADLADANLAGAYLADANLAGADLADAYLAGAENVPPIQQSAEQAPTEPRPRQTREEWLTQRATNNAERARRYREHNPDVPVVEALDAKILQLVEAGQGKLEMDAWHKCGTTHCRAGWAVHLAGEAGYALEKKLGGTREAGARIYRASVGYAPHFFEPSNERALEDIRRCAAEQIGETR
jgi:uncharacterized protein YjbI with pentapeptide repeats